MSSDEIAFLNAISTTPDDDLPRLVFADWLEEQGQGERAEFIRLQIERFRTSEQDSKRLSWREYELLQKSEMLWRDELPQQLQNGIAFRRGFIYRLDCTIRALIETTRTYTIRQPIELLHVRVDSVDPEWLAYHPPPLTLPLAEMQIDCPLSVGPLLIAALIRYGPFPKLKRLRVRDQNLGDEAIGLLKRLPTFPQLEELDLSSCGIGDRGAEELAESEWPRYLNRLVLSRNPISVGRLDWLRSRFGARLVVG